MASPPTWRRSGVLGMRTTLAIGATLPGPAGTAQTLGGTGAWVLTATRCPVRRHCSPESGQLVRFHR